MAGVNPKFWQGKRVFLTGHTGFKGSWLGAWLTRLGAHVTGFALPPQTTPSHFALLPRDYESIEGDIRDLEALSGALRRANPDIVLHLAAQSLVRASYADPVGTYATNVMGTLHVFEAIRQAPSARAALIVTSDKCYENRETMKPYVESDPMGGHDPYSSSKGCAEILTSSIRRSFFSDSPCLIASARAGNVIGGGDWTADALIPDCIRAWTKGEPVRISKPARRSALAARARCAFRLSAIDRSAVRRAFRSREGLELRANTRLRLAGGTHRRRHKGAAAGV